MYIYIYICIYIGTQSKCTKRYDGNRAQPLRSFVPCHKDVH